jgi:hypothetical protein
LQRESRHFAYCFALDDLSLNLDHDKCKTTENSRSAQISQLQTDLAATKRNLVQTQDELRNRIMDVKERDSELDGLRKIGQSEPDKAIDLSELQQNLLKFVLPLENKLTVQAGYRKTDFAAARCHSCRDDQDPPRGAVDA